MSPVHSVTHVPIHSPLSQVCLPLCTRHVADYSEGVAGGNGPLRWVTEDGGSFAGSSQGGKFLPSKEKKPCALQAKGIDMDNLAKLRRGLRDKCVLD